MIETAKPLEWFQVVPTGWQIRKLKYLASITLGKMLTSNAEDGFVSKLYLRAQNINWFSPNLDDVKKMWFSEIEMTRLRLRKSDLLVSEGGEVGRTCIWNDELAECFIQNSVHRVRFEGGLLPAFFLYQFFAASQFGYFDSIVNRISIAHLTGEKLKETLWFFPPLAEQLAIARYLEAKTAQIDDIIAKKQKLIELLREERTAIINQAVTKGLDRNMRMKRSGVDWLGEIPEHWEVKRLKYVAMVQPSNVDKKSGETEEGVLLCNYLDVYNNEFITSALEFMKATASQDEIMKFKIRFGDVLITKDSETPTDIAKAAFVTEGIENTLCGYHLAQIRPERSVLLGEYLFRLFFSKHFNDQFMVAANGITRYGLSVGAIAGAYILIPPLDEQKAISKEIESQCKQIDHTISRISLEIELLQEYQAALINEVVTGKIKVS